MLPVWMGTTRTSNTQPIRRQYSKFQPITMEETTLDTIRIVHEELITALELLVAFELFVVNCKSIQRSI